MNKCRAVGEKNLQYDEYLIPNEVSFVNICIPRFVRIRASRVYRTSLIKLATLSIFALLIPLIISTAYDTSTIFLTLNDELFK